MICSPTLLLRSPSVHRKRVQAQHHGLTLTGMYNVLEKLRANGSQLLEGAERLAGGEAQRNHRTPPDESPRPGGSARNDDTSRASSGAQPMHDPSTGGSVASLRDSTAPPAHLSQASGLKNEHGIATPVAPIVLTDKEKLIHDQGLVSVLKQLHDDLDAAVFAAYGWPTSLTDADILQRLVTLNAQRAAEEKQGIIHWLRPDYQCATPGSTQDEMALPVRPVKGKKLPALRSPSAKAAPPTKTPWPKPLAERIRATELALHASGGHTTAAALAQHFSRAKPADVQEILESLVTLGRARQEGEGFTL